MPPAGDEPPIEFSAKPLVPICKGVSVDPAMSWEDREYAKEKWGEAISIVQTFFGKSVEPPNGILCATEACAVAFSGVHRRSRATMQPRPTVILSGFDPHATGTLAHEMIHVEIARRFAGKGHALPAWFDEGVATMVGNNVDCPSGMSPAIDDLRRLAAPRIWTHFTNQPNRIQATYCQARRELLAWTKIHGEAALVPLIDSVANGESFEKHYGALVSASAAPSRQGKVGSFDFDGEDEGREVGEHGELTASLVAGAKRTPGYRGVGVRVAEGGFVRLSQWEALGLPDTAFSIALSVMPYRSARVLVHSAIQPDGGNGWCIPMLGHDEVGHLVAQVPFDAHPNAFLSAVGPKLKSNTWSHVVMTWGKTEGVRLYVNGTLAASRRPLNEVERHRDAPGGPLHLFFGGQARGHCWSGALESGDYNGVIDGIRVYNYALEESQAMRESAPGGRSREPECYFTI